MKLRLKLLLFLFPALLVSGLLLNYFTNKAVCAALHAEAAAAAAAAAKRALASGAPDLKKPEEYRLLPFLYSVAADTKASYACFVDANNTVLAHTNVAEKGKLFSPPAGLKALSSGGAAYAVQDHGAGSLLRVVIDADGEPELDAEELTLFKQPAEGRARRASLLLGLPLDASLATERHIAWRIALVLVLIYAAILLATYYSAGLTLKPISQLMAATERIRLGDYGGTISAAGAGEVADLARSFNEMSRTLSGTIVSKNYLDAIVDNMLDILVVAGLDGAIKKANRAAREELGATEAELSRLGILDIFSDEKPEYRGWLDLLREKGEVRDYESVLLSGRGGRRAVRVAASFIKDNDGARSGIVVTARDITLSKKHEAELARSNEDLQRFAFVASHDLQEPLRTISNYIRLLENKYRTELGKEAEQHAEFITGAVGRMRSLVRDLLEYSKINPSLRVEKVDAGEALDYVLAVLQDAVSEAGAVVERGPLPCIMADRGHLERLLQNLISNALKFRGQEPPRVLVGAEAENGAWTFYVRDNGAGINGDYSDKLFKLFGRLHGKGVAGSGIGLASCKKIVEYYGGRIWFSSEPGRGSTFYFTLPGRPAAE